MLRYKTRKFEALVHAYSDELFRYAYWKARDRHLAEDLVQETFARAWKAWDTLKDDGAARSWLYTILRREHARLYERKRLDMVDDLDLDTLRDPVHHGIDDELEMRQALHALPEGYREPLLLQVLGGFSCDEIAQVMESTPNAVMTRLSRARLALRRLMSDAPEERKA